MFLHANTDKAFKIVLTGFMLLTALQGPVLLAAEDDRNSGELITLRGVSHVHTTFSHDSNATLKDVLDGLEQENLDFAVITDHNSIAGQEMYQKMKGFTSMLIFANEISSPSGHLIALGVSEMPPKDASSQELVDWIHEKKGYAILAHPLSPREPWEDWEIKNWDGFEVYNFAHELYNQDAIGFGLSLYSEPEDTVLKTAQYLSPESEKMWDDVLKIRPISAIVGSNAHLKKNNKYFRVAVRSGVIYALVPDRSEAAVTRALGQGRSYMAFETRGRTEGFSFKAVSENTSYNIGDTVPYSPSGTALNVQVPEAAKIILIHKGDIIKNETSAEISFSAVDPGAYRVEVYKNNEIWIFTNPIYVGQKPA